MLVAEPRASVLSVGLSVGFSSQSTFYVAFKDEVGMVPVARAQAVAVPVNPGSTASEHQRDQSLPLRPSTSRVVSSGGIGQGEGIGTTPSLKRPAVAVESATSLIP